MNTRRQTDGFTSVYVSEPGGANRVLSLSYRAPVDSTNSACLQALAEPASEDWALLWTDCQTAGRGRQGRSWLSRPGDSLCLTVGRRLPAGCTVQPALTVALGAALADALCDAGYDVTLKWPNDLLLGGGKVAGLLCEASSAGGNGSTALVAGVGVNLRSFALPDGAIQSSAGAPAGLQPAALSAHGPEPDAAQLARRLAQTMANLLVLADNARALSDWCVRAAALDAWRGQSVSVFERGSVVCTGVALGVHPDGQYRVQTADGERLLAIGELSLRGGA